MKLPKSLVVKGTIWEVRIVRRIESPDKMGRETWGLADGDEQVIYIKRGLSAEEQLTTFIHEVFHAIELTYGFDMPHSLIYKLEGPIKQLILDNLYV